MIKTYPILATILLLFGTTKSHAQFSETLLVQGEIDTVPNATYFISYQNEGVLVRDTVSLDSKRKFEFRGPLSDPTRFYIAIENTYNPALAGDFVVYEFWVEPGKTISFKGRDNWLVKGIRGMVGKGKITRSEPSEMEEMAQRYNEYLMQSIKNVEEHSERPLSDILKSQLRDSLQKAFIRKHTDSYYALFQLYLMARSSLNQDVAFIKETLPLFPESIRRSYRAKEIGKRIAVHTIAGIGQIMPDFEQADTSSNAVRLSDFRGKYVLVDFWASWCGPCREENPYLVEAHQKFASKGFDILGVSLDLSKNRWLEAIRKDGLNWTHVSDLKGFDNSVAKRFFIHAIPDNFLLDPDGVIIARNLNGRELLRKMETIFDN